MRKSIEAYAPILGMKIDSTPADCLLSAVHHHRQGRALDNHAGNPDQLQPGLGLVEPIMNNGWSWQFFGVEELTEGDIGLGDNAITFFKAFWSTIWANSPPVSRSLSCSLQSHSAFCFCWYCWACGKIDAFGGDLCVPVRHCDQCVQLLPQQRTVPDDFFPADVCRAAQQPNPGAAEVILGYVVVLFSASWFSHILYTDLGLRDCIPVAS